MTEETQVKNQLACWCHGTVKGLSGTILNSCFNLRGFQNNHCGLQEGWKTPLKDLKEAERTHSISWLAAGWVLS